MAKATKQEVTTTTVVLELTEKEAQRLRALLGELPIASGAQPSLYSVYRALEHVTTIGGGGVVVDAFCDLRAEA